MNALKLIARVVLVLLALVVLAVAVVAWRFDPHWATQKLAQAVYDQKQRKLTIAGDVALSFYPSIGVRLGKASLSEHASPQEFASIDNARVSVRVLPLLSREVVVDRIDLDGVRAHIVRHKDGTFNFDDLLHGTEQGKPGTTTAQRTPAGFDIAGVRITRSAFTVQDDQAGRTIQLDDVNVKTGRLAQSASGPLEVSFKARSAQPQLDAAFQLRGDYRYDLSRKQYDIEKLDVKVQGDAVGLRQLDVALHAKEAGLGGAGGGIQADELALTAKGQMADGPLEANVNVPHLALVNDRAKGQNASASIRMGGKARQVDAKLNLSAIEGAAARWEIGKLDAQWTLNQGPLAVQGHAAGPVRIDLDAKSADVVKLGGDLQLAHPQLPMKQLRLPLDAALHVDWGRMQAAGQLSTRIEDSAVNGKFQVTKFAPLAAGFDLAIDKLDLDRYLGGPPKAPAATQAAATPAPAAQAAPIDFSFLRGLDLQGGVRVGFLQARNLKFSNLTGNVVVRNGRLDLNPVSAALYGGTVAGSLTAQADGNRVAIKQTMNNVAIGPLIKDYAQKDVLEGRGHIALDVQAAGTTVAAVRQSLSGTAAMSLHDGAVKGINLAKSLRDAKSMIAGGGKQDAVVAADKGEKTDFSEMTASFHITNGVARNDDLSAKSPFLRATGAGTIDLAREQLDYLAKVTVVNTAKGEEGKDLAQLNGLTVPVRLSGPLEHPTWRLEFGALAAQFAKQQVQKQLGQQLDKQLGKQGLGDVLKGLIK